MISSNISSNISSIWRKIWRKMLEDFVFHPKFSSKNTSIWRKIWRKYLEEYLGGNFQRDFPPKFPPKFILIIMEENLEEIVAWWVGPPAVVGPPFLPTPTRGRSARTGKWLVDVKSLKVCGGWVPARLCRCVVWGDRGAGNVG